MSLAYFCIGLLKIWIEQVEKKNSFYIEYIIEKNLANDWKPRQI